jgi:hypothetical protein
MRVIGLVLLAMGLLALASRPKQVFHHNDLKVEFETKQWQFNGRYTSFYANRKKWVPENSRSINALEFGLIWDSTGKVMMQGNYETPFEYSIKYSELPKSKSIELFSKITFNYTPGVDGYIEYYFTQDNSVLEAHRVWRELNPEENRMLFRGFDLWDELMEGLSKKAITAYSPKDDEF